MVGSAPSRPKFVNLSPTPSDHGDDEDDLEESDRLIALDDWGDGPRTALPRDASPPPRSAARGGPLATAFGLLRLDPAEVLGESLPRVSASSRSPPKASIQCNDRARHVLLSLRLRKGYIVYCFCCFLLSVVVCFTSFMRIANAKLAGEDILAAGPYLWETALEVAIGLAVCGETAVTLWLAGRQAFIRDCWCLFDAGVCAATLLNWALLAARRLSMVLASDVFLISLRFVMQPCRLLAALSMYRRGLTMHQSNDMDISFGAPEKEAGYEL